MQDSSVGHHCEEPGCNKKEYFSFECKDCNKFFCGEHRHVVCEMAKMNPEKPLETDKRIKEPCSFILMNSESNEGEKCPDEALSKCPLCGKMFCLNHRFED